MAITWRTEEYRRDNGDIDTRIFVQMTNTSADAVERIEEGLQHVKETEHREIVGGRRLSKHGEGSISMSDFTHYEWDDKTYTGVILLQLIGVTNELYKTRVGQMLDLTHTGTEKTDDAVSIRDILDIGEDNDI